MAEGIQIRGPHQFRVQVRRNGVYQTRTFETLREAQEWQRFTEGKVTGEEVVDPKLARSTTLAQACDWMLDGKRFGGGADAKNVSAKLRYWQGSKFARWSLAAYPRLGFDRMAGGGSGRRQRGGWRTLRPRCRMRGTNRHSPAQRSLEADSDMGARTQGAAGESRQARRSSR
jgi:hypothetical protein